jgi:multimeric flavodoxin WrbA
MNIMIFSASTNLYDLTSLCGEEARISAINAGAEVLSICLDSFNIGSCKKCMNSWEECEKNEECSYKDDFQKIHLEMKKADGYIFIMPIYQEKISDAAKVFLERLKRFENTRANKSIVRGKPIIAISESGNSLEGALDCLKTMEALIDHLGGVKFDFINISENNKEYKMDTVIKAAAAMVHSLRIK